MKAFTQPVSQLTRETFPGYCNKSIITSSWQGHTSVLLINRFQEEDYQKVVPNSPTARQCRLPCSLQGGYQRFPFH